MKNIVITTCMLLITVGAESQTNAARFGIYSLAEMQLADYENDKGCEAFVISDKGKSYFVENNGFDVVFERSTKIKIFKKSGFKWANVEIPFYIGDNDFERVDNIEAYTYNLNDGNVDIKKLDLQAVYEETRSERWKVMKFAMPDVKEGSVIEYRYKISSPFIFNLHDWDFQWLIPVAKSEYTAKMIPYYTYSYILQGGVSLNTFEHAEDSGLPRTFRGFSFHDMVYTFGLNNIPAFVPDDYISSINDYIIKLDFQLSEFVHPDNGFKEQIITTWPKLSEELLKSDQFGSYIKTSKRKGAKLLPKILRDSLSADQKAGLIFEYVKRNYKWNGSFDKYTIQSASQFLKTKQGNSANINLLLLGMLQAAGIEAYPVIISTRGHGKIAVDYPFHHFFNDVIVMVKPSSKVVMLDATEPNCPFGVLPQHCINDDGLIVKKAEKAEWADLHNSFVSVDNITINQVVNPATDTIACSLKRRETGYFAFSARNKCDENNDQFKDDLLTPSQFDASDFVIKNDSNLNNPLYADFKSLVTADNVGSKLIVNPFLGYPLAENPFKKISRSYPIDMVFLKRYIYTSIIEIPANYTFEIKEKNIEKRKDVIDYSFKIQKISNTKLLVTAAYEFKKSVYGISDYVDLKLALKDIIETINEKIVINPGNKPQ